MSQRATQSLGEAIESKTAEFIRVGYSPENAKEYALDWIKRLIEEME
jgi:hypothetical protein